MCLKALQFGNRLVGTVVFVDKKFVFPKQFAEFGQGQQMLENIGFAISGATTNHDACCLHSYTIFLKIGLDLLACWSA
jgi:hypothetical protein